MKIRIDFVTNSSSSSFVFWGYYSKELLSYVTDLIRKGYIYNKETDEFDPETMIGYLVSDERRNKGLGTGGDLIFFPFSWKDKIEKTGFQIAETWVTHGDPLNALLSFINLEQADPYEAEKIRGKLTELVESAEKEGLILHARRNAMTDQINLHFSEQSIEESYFTVRSSMLVSCKKKNATNIDMNFASAVVIGKEAFKDMKDLKRIKINAGSNAIEEAAFMGCTSLEQIENTFYWGLFDHEIPRYVIPKKYPDYSLLLSVNIKKNAFKDCRSLKAIHFKARSILTSAFEGCESLEAIEFHDGFGDDVIRKIDSRAFADCTDLRDVYFPDDPKTSEGIMELQKADKGIRSISPTAFKNCDNVTFHVYEGTYAHKYAAENNIRFELTDRFPRDYLVQKMMIRKSRIAESLSIGDLVTIKPAEMPFVFSVFNDKGQELGEIYERRLTAWNFINDNIESIAAKVKSFTPLDVVRQKYPKENSAELFLTLERI